MLTEILKVFICVELHHGSCTVSVQIDDSGAAGGIHLDISPNQLPAELLTLCVCSAFSPSTSEEFGMVILKIFTHKMYHSICQFHGCVIWPGTGGLLVWVERLKSSVLPRLGKYKE